MSVVGEVDIVFLDGECVRVAIKAQLPAIAPKMQANVCLHRQCLALYHGRVTSYCRVVE